MNANDLLWNVHIYRSRGFAYDHISIFKPYMEHVVGWTFTLINAFEMIFVGSYLPAFFIIRAGDQKFIFDDNDCLQK